MCVAPTMRTKPSSFISVNSLQCPMKPSHVMSAQCRVRVPTGVFKIIEGPFHAFQRFANSKLRVKTVEIRFPALNYFENASAMNSDLHVYPSTKLTVRASHLLSSHAMCAQCIYKQYVHSACIKLLITCMFHPST
jgi:hypothetical protein